jgi:hypothetical protein
VKKKRNPTQNLIQCTPTQKNQTFPSSKPDSLADSCTEKSLFYGPFLAVAQVGTRGYSNAACQPQTTASAIEKQCDTPCAIQRIAALVSLFHSPKE